MIVYPLHVQERFARLLHQRADQSLKAKVAAAPNLGKATDVARVPNTVVISHHPLTSA
jgi:hypothetical protein